MMDFVRTLRTGKALARPYTWVEAWKGFNPIYGKIPLVGRKPAADQSREAERKFNMVYAIWSK